MYSPKMQCPCPFSSVSNNVWVPGNSGLKPNSFTAGCRHHAAGERTASSYYEAAYVRNTGYPLIHCGKFAHYSCCGETMFKKTSRVYNSNTQRAPIMNILLINIELGYSSRGPQLSHWMPVYIYLLITPQCKFSVCQESRLQTPRAT